MKRILGYLAVVVGMIGTTYGQSSVKATKGDRSVLLANSHATAGIEIMGVEKYSDTKNMLIIKYYVLTHDTAAIELLDKDTSRLALTFLKKKEGTIKFPFNVDEDQVQLSFSFEAHGTGEGRTVIYDIKKKKLIK